MTLVTLSLVVQLAHAASLMKRHRDAQVERAQWRGYPGISVSGAQRVTPRQPSLDTASSNIGADTSDTRANNTQTIACQSSRILRENRIAPSEWSSVKLMQRPAMKCTIFGTVAVLQIS